MTSIRLRWVLCYTIDKVHYSNINTNRSSTVEELLVSCGGDYEVHYSNIMLLHSKVDITSDPPQLRSCWLVVGVKVPIPEPSVNETLCTANPLNVFSLPVKVTAV